MLAAPSSTGKLTRPLLLLLLLQNRLVRLPPSILRLIFADIGDHGPGALTLCRVLHDYFLHAVYASVTFDTPRRIKAFVRTLQHRPEFARFDTAATFYQSAADEEASLPERDRDVSDPGPSSGPRDGLPRAPAPLLLALPPARADPSPSLAAEQKDEDDISVDFGLLSVLLFCMPNVIILGVFGGKLASALFAPELVASSRYPRFTHLVVTVDHDDPVDVLPTLGRDLSRLTHLSHVALMGFDRHMPVATLNLGAAYLPPRSMHLDSFDLTNCMDLRPEVRHLFQALAPGLASFNLATSWAYPALVDDLALLPPTVSTMLVAAGLYACGTPDDVKAMKGFPDVFAYTANMRKHEPDIFSRPFTSALSLPPALTSLKLQGDIVSADTFPLLLDLPDLRTLHLGAHTQFRTPDLITFLHSSRTLTTLGLDVCACAPAPSASASAARRARPLKAKAKAPSTGPPAPKPVWRDGFREEDAQVVVRMCGGRGIAVEGSVVCATRSAGAERAHECRGWCRA